MRRPQGEGFQTCARNSNSFNTTSSMGTHLCLPRYIHHPYITPDQHVKTVNLSPEQIDEQADADRSHAHEASFIHYPMISIRAHRVNHRPFSSRDCKEKGVVPIYSISTKKLRIGCVGLVILATGFLVQNQNPYVQRSLPQTTMR
jgi:hypothetical protein